MIWRSGCARVPSTPSMRPGSAAPAPVVPFARPLTAGLLAPTVVRAAPLEPFGDLIAVVDLFALARFATALAGLDAGGAFGGMGSSREMAIAALAEPVLLLAFFVPIVHCRQHQPVAHGRRTAPPWSARGGFLASPRSSWC